MCEMLINKNIKDLENQEISAQVGRFKQWNSERENMLNAHMKEIMRDQKEQEIKAKLLELQEREEVLSYFDNEDAIKIIRKNQKFMKKKKRRYGGGKVLGITRKK